MALNKEAPASIMLQINQNINISPFQGKKRSFYSSGHLRGKNNQVSNELGDKNRSKIKKSKKLCRSCGIDEQI